MVRPPNLVITSPSAMPAAAAGPPCTTLSTWAPSDAFAETSRVLAPRLACLTVPVRISDWAILVAWSIGIAKPRPMLPPPLPRVGAAVGLGGRS